jgi:hypothetical protein
VSGQHHAPAALYPRGKSPRTHCTGDWVGPRAGLDTEVTGKILCLCRGSNPGRPVRLPVNELSVSLKGGKFLDRLRVPLDSQGLCSTEVSEFTANSVIQEENWVYWCIYIRTHKSFPTNLYTRYHSVFMNFVCECLKLSGINYTTSEGAL